MSTVLLAGRLPQLRRPEPDRPQPPNLPSRSCLGQLLKVQESAQPSRCQTCLCATLASASKATAAEGPEDPVDLHPKEVISKQDAILMMGLGTWRLRPMMAPAFEALGAQLEGGWRHLPLGSLHIEALPKEYEYADSINPGRQHAESFKLPSPKKGQPGWPRLQIENRCYSTRVFRKLHLELAHRQDDLQVLHCVLYPRASFDIPILSIDMVGKGNQVSLCIIDPCPVRSDRSLPIFFRDIALELQGQLGLSSNRQAPEWGRAIFSDLCILMRPSTSSELASFLKYAIALHQAYLNAFASAAPVQNNRDSRMADIQAAHGRYALHQRQNDRTRKVLEAAFGPAFAEAYMNEVMFDNESKQPPAAEAS